MIRKPKRFAAVVAVVTVAAVFWTGMSPDAAARSAATQVKNLKWQIRGATVHGSFDVDLARFKPLFEKQVIALLRKKSPRLFKRFTVGLRRYERGRLISDKVKIAPVKGRANRITYDIRGRIVANRYARVLSRRRHQPIIRWVRRGTALLARFRLTGRATISVVQGERLSGRFLRVVVRGQRLRAQIKIPLPIKLSLKLGDRRLATRRLAVLNRRLLRRHPLLRSARLVKLHFQRSGTRYLRVQLVAR